MGSQVLVNLVRPCQWISKREAMEIGLPRLCKIWDLSIAMPVFLLLFSSACGATDLTVWLIPSVPGGESAPTAGELEAFDRRSGSDGPVTVINTTDPFLCDQLLSRNPEFSEPDWHMIVSQKAVLNELVRFAQENHVHLHVRFLSWCRAFSYLQSALGRSESEIKPDSMRLPDVAQVGDTWVAYLHENDALMHRPDNFSDQLSWRSIPGRMNVSLRYITDLRLLFYWKRLPGHAPDLEPFVLDPATWETAIDSVVGYACHYEDDVLPPISFPLALTPNLIHDYAPLVWSGGGRFLEPRKRKMLVSSDQALAVPLLLARNASRTGSGNNAFKVLSFPEIKDRNSLFVNETTPDFSIVSRPPAPALRRNMLRRRAGAGGRAVVESELEWAKIADELNMVFGSRKNREKHGKRPVSSRSPAPIPVSIFFRIGRDSVPIVVLRDLGVRIVVDEFLGYETGLRWAGRDFAYPKDRGAPESF